MVQAFNVDLRELGERHRRNLFRRLALLRGWEDAIAAARASGGRRAVERATAQYIEQQAAEGVRVSERTLYLWRRRFRAFGSAGLVDGRRSRPTSPFPANDPFMRELAGRWLSWRLPRATQAYRETCLMARSRGWKVYSYSQCVRALRKLPEGRYGSSKRARRLAIASIRDEGAVSSVFTHAWN